MITFRPLTPCDREEYIAMVRSFYATDAVIRPIPTAHIEAGFEEALRADTYAVAVIFEKDGQTVGYALLGKTFSQEAGGMTLWLEELFVKEEFRGQGIGKAFLRNMTANLPPHIRRVRLEVERDNEAVVGLYQSVGFDWFEYDQMSIER